MKTFLKGIIVGVGGVAPGLSGSVLLIIFGLYQKTLDALGNLFVDIKKNIQFLCPLILGMFCGVLLFSKVIDFFLNTFEMPTRFCFLGLILGTIPLLYKELKKEEFSKFYYIIVGIAALIGTYLFTVNPNAFPQISEPTIFQSIILGVAVVATAIIPGLDPAVVLSTLGFYEVYVSSLANFNLNVLAPMLIGLAIGGIGISYFMSLLFKRYYTATFSTVFGLFLSMIPNMLNESCILKFDIVSILSILLMLIGFIVSYFLGDLENNQAKLKKFMK